MIGCKIHQESDDGMKAISWRLESLKAQPCSNSIDFDECIGQAETVQSLSNNAINSIRPRLLMVVAVVNRIIST